MARSQLFWRLISDMRFANDCAANKITIEEGFKLREKFLAIQRRDFIKGVAGAAAVASFPGMAFSAPANSVDVGIANDIGK